MRKFTEGVTKILSFVLIVLMALIVIDVTWQVFTRFVLRTPSGFTEELAGFLLIWIGLLGASYTYCKKAHLGIDTVVAKFSGRRKVAAEVGVAAMVFFFALFIMVIGGARLLTITFTLRQISPAMKIPMGYIYSVLPISGLLFMYYSVAAMFETVTQAQSSEMVDG
ncbi:MAG: TRAP transporter small permease [Chitinispirillaceae bacterium]|nr:TRAP transporter small permease [Chitinispirillaceae bacterium]